MELENIKCSVCPKKMEWIPCSERLPKNPEMECIVCFSGTFQGRIYDHGVISGNDTTYKNGKWYLHGGYKKNTIVHAWMPFPYPYMEEGEQDG